MQPAIEETAAILNNTRNSRYQITVTQYTDNSYIGATELYSNEKIFREKGNAEAICSHFKANIRPNMKPGTHIIIEVTEFDITNAQKLNSQREELLPFSKAEIIETARNEQAKQQKAGTAR